MDACIFAYRAGLYPTETGHSRRACAHEGCALVLHRAWRMLKPGWHIRRQLLTDFPGWQDETQVLADQDKDGSRGVREASGLEEDAAWLINSSKPSQSPLFCIWFLTSTASHHSPILMSPAAISIPGAQLSICSARINTAVLSTAARDDPWRTIKLNADSH